MAKMTTLMEQEGKEGMGRKPHQFESAHTFYLSFQPIPSYIFQRVAAQGETVINLTQMGLQAATPDFEERDACIEFLLAAYINICGGIKECGKCHSCTIANV
eukprot:511027-Pelagomonas_calceolata.AAC.2